MAKAGLLTYAVGELERRGIPYMLSSFQGEPRSTHDIDIVVEIRPDQLSSIVAAFPLDQYFLSPAAVKEAIDQRSMFNVIDMEGDGKVDFWLLTEEAFDQNRFARRRREDFSGLAVWISSPEDTILMKLRWSRESGGSERHFRDALRVYEVQSGQLDTAYVKQWIEALNLRDLWTRLLAEANPL